ncbi:microtubule-associated protein 9 isoform X1 [Takifugu flavidus]|uniref:microtubule-associated protein 9 isoform X1 n=1 Tax=Takifugu flavidus TaxID=433684 RepID=UPI00254418AE|nr:microtubule-associated protein 9 isoform X1 [Takifugu flavidus]XP_056892595.1 microtubule-associated protein 9 isoform X1 [Takifugu flavidus]
MTNQEISTLNYTTRPKTAKRTTFQDELKAAVSARSRDTEMDQYSYSDDFSEAEDDFLHFLKSRQKKTGTFEDRNNVADKEPFDDRGQAGRMKRVSFMDTFSIGSDSEGVKDSDSHEHHPVHSSVHQQKKFNHLFSLQDSNNDDRDATFINEKGASARPQLATLDASISSSDPKEDIIVALPLVNSETEPPDPEERSSCVLQESCQTPQLSTADLRALALADDLAQKEPPKPKPRQRTFGKKLQTVDKVEEDAESQEFSRPQTSSISIPLYTDTSSDPAWAEEERMNSCSNSEQWQLRDNFVSDNNNNNPDSKDSGAFEENHYPVAQLDHLSHLTTKTDDSRTSRNCSKTTQKSQRLLYKTVESKYLGTCKLLDHKVCVDGSQPQTVNSLRAVVYQKWLQEKKEAMKETMLLKKKEEITRDKKEKEQEDQKEAAVAAYEAWRKCKSENLEVKAREKQAKMRKEQRDLKEKEERKQSAKQVYEKWKSEHDQKLKEKLRKQREVERKSQSQKQENEEDRRKDSKYAFTSWSEKKKNVIHEKVTTESKCLKNKAEEERYLKEERDQMALEAYENWLTRKFLEDKRQREEMRIQTILRESPPPPWNPPNKTIPFRK